MTGLYLSHVKTYVVVPALTAINLASSVAVNLVLGTAIAESGLQYLHQIGGGPACGLFQMEPATETDLWNRIVAPNPILKLAMLKLISGSGPIIGDTITWNLQYAAAMCRLKYYDSPLALPANTATALATYWKTIYNTSLGAGSVDAAHVAYFQQALDVA